MPFTAFHVAPVWPLYVKWPRRWDILALSFGAVMPDLETVTIYPLTQDVSFARGLMHSVLGVLTVNLLLTVVAARILAPWIAASLDRRFPGKGWRLFARHDVVSDHKAWPVTITSAAIGGLTHLGIDLLHHLDTPLLWPWRASSLHLLPWSGDILWTYAVNAAFGGLFLAMMLKWVGR